MSLYTLLRPVAFLMPPERGHRAAVCLLRQGVLRAPAEQNPRLQIEVAGLHFENPIGLAPGFDKNAECFEGALKAGFGFTEVGTVTPRPQSGNPAPRVFRLVQHEAVINRLGFNNEGVHAAAHRLKQRSGSGIVGGNIGKNKESAEAVADYCAAMQVIYPYVDYITANISSPNTPGLRSLQAADELMALITALQAVRQERVSKGECYRPIFVKIAPDGDGALFDAIADVARSSGVDGLIVSNTTVSREAVAGDGNAGEAGGLSGKPLFGPSTRLLAQMYSKTGGKIPLIGVGGVSSAEDAYAKIRAGASLVQLYTALIYQGFGLVETIKEGLVRLLDRDGCSSIREAVGVGVERLQTR